MKNTSFNRIFLALMLAGAPLVAHAGAEDKLLRFIARVHSAQADFTQEVRDKKGNVLQSAEGVMQFSRPGKFRWVYQKPYAQIIVGDGRKFWLYDVELNQVTVRRLDTVLGNSPAALLSGGREITRDFILRDIRCINGGAAASPASAPHSTAARRASVPSSTAAQPASAPDSTAARPAAAPEAAAEFACAKGEQGLDWLEAIPKLRDTSFDRIRMAFNARSELVVMELHDALGHTTVLHFSHMRVNPGLRPGLFKFEPPADADVLTDQ